ncbi:hypothetical protein EPUS_06262 [Endocarpon pusillum Z07020]|uniref:T6SS Phospholipase effector Tle1-like catalytic domain-containing protein n=1 Tax=Endocarpon pusillum (strain Z07020 / HMAS-L-300199) TaxID=1263415 RepID=U1G9Y0_ENDPU|nr:uncharacterized protein EPUS_06262 [Endocarpon pusillum Z07020]ERF68818.1 hypothetical protein EPUS_06262 [Endocarpon pusillum Z07020]
MKTISATAARKRIVVACDGTWKDSDGEYEIPSNVTRICRCIKQEARDAETGEVIPQIIYYQSGVGTESTIYNKIVGGSTGLGLAEHIREAYSFICNNYETGDEIILIGFSRGAFTARSIATLIGAIGLLNRQGLIYFYQIFQDWQHQMKPNWKSSYPKEPWENRPPVHKPEYGRKLLELELTRPNIPVKAIGVWDTVGALGIPMVAFLPQPKSSEFAFVDTKIEPHIEHAFQALALDERRRTFQPTIWEKPEGQEWPLTMKQCWFPGVHSDVGGSYADADLANLTLTWMISQLEPFLAFDHSYIVQQNRLTMERHIANGHPMRKWGLGRIQDSMTLIFRLAGSARRTPHEYHAIDRLTYKAQRRLLNTHEYVHASVRIRMGLKGYGYNDKGLYDSEGLEGWTMHGTESAGERGELGGMRDVKWVKRDPQRRNDPPLIMPEDELAELEHEIMKSWPDVERGFASIRPGTHHMKMHKSSTDPLALSPGYSVVNGRDYGIVRVVEFGKAKISPRMQTL